MLLSGQPQEGLCSFTSFKRNCSLHDSGAWKASRHGVFDIHSCAKLCRSCPRCQFATYSRTSNDCSWHARCPVLRPNIFQPDAITMAMRSSLAEPPVNDSNRGLHGPTALLPAPRSSASFSDMMARTIASNATLLDYVFPTAPKSGAVFKHWSAYTEGCRIANDCFCFHTTGEMSRSRNPGGWKRCATKSTLKVCGQHIAAKNCSCFVQGPDEQGPCLFSDMRPIKILSAITAARMAGVTHIVEEGRFGGLSALMYHVHGFHVTSIEFLPLDGATSGLAKLAPSAVLITADGAVEVPRLLNKLSSEEAARTMVIFDGEKRLDAWSTFLKVREKVALAIFDDTNGGSGEGHRLKKLWNSTGEVWWDTTFLPGDFLHHERPSLSTLSADLKRGTGGKRLDWQGGVNHLSIYHFSIVRGDAWV